MANERTPGNAHDPDPSGDRMSAGRRDVEKRWSEPGAFRRVAIYGGGVVLVALVLLALFLAGGGSSVVLAGAVPAVSALGGLGALAIGFAAYRRGGSWVQWQGCAWFLLALMLVTLSLPLAAR